MQRAETPFTEQEFGETVFSDSSQEIRERLRRRIERGLANGTDGSPEF
jgi:hypothetical protein